MKKTTAAFAVMIAALFLAACAPAFVRTRETRSVSDAREVRPVFTLMDEGTAAFAPLPEALTELRFNAGEKTVDRAVERALVFSSDTNGATLTFGARLYAGRLDKDFNFLEYVVLPSVYEKMGNRRPSADFGTLEVRLTDVADRSNTVVYRNVIRPDVNYTTSGRAGAAGQSVEGLVYPAGNFLTGYGTPLRNSFTGAFESAVYAGAVSYDDAERAVYAYPTHTGGKIVVRDMDSGEHMLTGDTLWKGFTSGELEVSVRLLDIAEGRTASVALLSYNGMPLDDASADILPPEVFATDMPEGVGGEAGKRFPIFNYASCDGADGFVRGASVRVFADYKTAGEKECPVVDGGFVPDRPGTYTLVAQAADAAGNVGKCETEIVVVSKLKPLSLRMDGEIPSSVFVGERVVCPSAIVAGGTAGRGYELKVYKDGEPVELDKEGGITFGEQGMYVIRYEAFDYLKAPVYFDYYARATLSRKPLVRFPYLPAAVPAGVAVKIPAYPATDWFSSAGFPLQALTTAVVVRPDGRSEEIGPDGFVPTEGRHTVRLSAAAVLDPAQKTEREYVVDAVKADKVADYFLLDGAKTTELEGYTVIENVDSGSAAFINPLPTDSFKLKFVVPAGCDNFSALYATLTDSLDPSLAVTAAMRPAGQYDGTIELCGKSYPAGSSFDPGMPFSLTYVNGALYNMKVMVGEITAYDDGRTFGGFPSGKAYLTLRFGDADGRAAVRLEELCNHTDFLTGAVDNSVPIVSLSGSIVSSAEIGDKVTIPAAEAYDIFRGACSVRAELVKNGSSAAQSDGPLTFAVDAYGVYSIRLTAADDRGNSVTVSHNIYADNMARPVLSLSGPMPSSGKTGSRVSLPAATASAWDGSALDVAVFIKRPGGSYSAADENGGFTPDAAGVYTVYYYAYDENCNPGVLKFRITVK